MRKLEKSYGKNTFDVWAKGQPKDLRPTQTRPVAADKNIWEVSSFQQLLEHVAFLSSMNKRLILFYRGQTQEWDPLPTLFRSSWKCFDSDQTFAITHENRTGYWDKLKEIGQRVCKICDEERFKVPRRRGLQH